MTLIAMMTPRVLAESLRLLRASGATVGSMSAHETAKILTADAAEIFGCWPSRVNQLVDAGTLPVLETVGERSPIRVFSRKVVEALAGSRDGSRAGRWS